MADKRAFLDFKAIKERVPFSGVLAHYRVELKRANTTTLKGNCPLPSHTSKAPDTFYVNTEKNVFYCHSDSCKKGGHRAGGNTLDFCAAMNPGWSAYDAAKQLDELFPANGNPATEPAKTELVVEGNKPLAFALKDVNPVHPFLQGKGISAETAALFGVGFFGGKGSMSQRIVFPLYEDGKMIGYAGRLVKEILNAPNDEPEAKWKLPKGLVKSFLYNLERCNPAMPLILCESFWGPLWFHEAGAQAASLMGSTLTPEQEKCLEPFKVIWLALDNNEAGRAASEKIVRRLKGKHMVRKAHLRGTGGIGRLFLLGKEGMPIFHSRKPRHTPERWTLDVRKVAGKPQSIGWPSRWKLEPAAKNAREERMKKK